MSILDHAKTELKLAGYNIDKKVKNIETSRDYADSIAQSVLELLKVFVKQGHSGMSASYTLQLFNQLAKEKNLTELTDDPSEWKDLKEFIGNQEEYYQSKRNSSCFSRDLKTYYDIDDPDNNIFEKDDNGELTGYASLKPEAERKMVVLKHVDSKWV